VSHRFGGSWTEVKLDTVAGYLGYYSTVLRTVPTPDRPFRRWYIDAFAGSGSRTVSVTNGGTLFDEEPNVTEEIEIAGSARRALAVDPPFDQLVFIEGHRGRFSDLQRLRAEFPNRNISCRRGDANEQLASLFGDPPWSGQSSARGRERAVLFLDPYGMNVRWETLTMLAATQAVDVWYLFPLEGACRQMAHDLGRVDASKASALDRIFGTPDWRQDLYRTEYQGSLLDFVDTPKTHRAPKAQVEAYALKRLGSLFSYVSRPLPVLNHSDRQLFSLVCIANPATEAARRLIERGVNWVFKQQSPASRHKSAR
jgi:three-Cys-motif partner protein